MTRTTALHGEHVAAGARLVDFAGWEMPLHYGSQIDEHQAVRSDAGMFDVSHMAVVDFRGDSSAAFLSRLLANDIGKLAEDQALYSAMLNEQGGVIDDLIVYRNGERFRTVVNASRREVDLAWMRRHAAAFGVEVAERTDLGIIAVQGPNAVQRGADAIAEAAGMEAGAIRALAPFHSLRAGDWLVARTGYTGEDGVEVLLPANSAVGLWRDLRGAGVRPAGLGARDTLRLEAGLNLYGHEMDETVTPLEANMAWTVAWQPEDRDFIGRRALEALRGRHTRKLTGVVLEARGVVRAGQSVDCGAAGEGVVTSGIYSPTLRRGIGMCRVPRAAKGECWVIIRGKPVAARLVKMPFVRAGDVLVT